MIEKLQLEKQICIEQGYRYEVVTETQMSSITLANLKFLWHWTRLKRPAPSESEQNSFIRVLRQQDFDDSLGHVLEKVAKELCIAPSLAIWNFRYLAWKRFIKFDLEAPLQLTSPHLGLRMNLKHGD